MESESNLLFHGPCDVPSCNSSDANAHYDDGHTYCFSCGAHTQAAGGAAPTSSKRRHVAADLITEGLEVKPLGQRKITQETCQHFGYLCGVDEKGRAIQVAPYFDADGNPVAQKLRGQDKMFSVRGSLKQALPFGAQCWQKTGKKIVVTEGEIDALSMSQVQGNRFPVVSIPGGAQNAKKHMAEQLDYYRGFLEVVLMFDMDEPGRKAARECATVLGARARIAELPGFKDANEMLQAGKGDELIQAMWRAKEWSPDGIVELSSLRDAVLTAPTHGTPWWSPALTELTYGIRRGEIYAFGAGTGMGKSDFLTQEIADLVQRGHACGVFSLEQHPVETTKRIAGKVAGRPFHIPDAGWNKEELVAALDKLERGAKVFLYDSFGANAWDSIKEHIEYLVHAHDVRYIFLDHISALAAASNEEDERKALDHIMSDMGSLVKKLDIALFIVSHLKTPDKGSHEEGARVTIGQFRGSRAVGFWSHYMIGFERNQQADAIEDRSTTTVRVLKDRYTGRATGSTFKLGYEHDTGLLFEKPAVSAGAHGFMDESGETSDF